MLIILKELKNTIQKLLDIVVLVFAKIRLIGRMEIIIIPI